MDINLKVKLEAPELMAALLALAEALPQLQTVARVAFDNNVQAVKVIDAVVKTPKEVSKVTLEQVKAKLEALNKAGRIADAKELLRKFGAKKVSEVAEENYEALVKETEAVYLN
jgi:hypothetical protein